MQMDSPEDMSCSSDDEALADQIPLAFFAARVPSPTSFLNALGTDIGSLDDISNEVICVVLRLFVNCEATSVS